MIAAAPIAVALLAASGCGGSGDRSASIAARINASNCSRSGFYIQSRIDDRKQTVYDCLMPSGTYKCVTESGGIASDSTAEVRLLFENVLGGTRPTCLG